MPGENSLEIRERNRERLNRSIGLGVGGFLAATFAAVVAPASVSDLFLFAGVGAYYLGVAGSLVVWHRSAVPLFDEREAQIERRAARVVAGVIVGVTIVGIPADVVLDVTGVVDVPPVLRGAIWGYALLAVFGAFAYGYAERQYS